MDVSRADNCQKLTNIAISDPKQDLYNINAYTCIHSLVKIHWYMYLLKVSSGNENTNVSRQIIVKNWWNLPISNHKPTYRLVKIHRHLLKLSSENENTDGRTGGRMDEHTDSQRETIIIHNNSCFVIYESEASPKRDIG